MTKFQRITTLSLSLLLLVGAFFVSPARAIESATNAADVGQALEIRPPVLNLTADPGQNLEAKISILDVSPSPLIVSGEVNDFIAAGEDGTPKLLLEEGETSPYSLKKWIDPLPRLTLKPKQAENFPVSIRIPADAAPGGYFAVVRFTASAPDIDQTGVSLSASLGTLILVRVNGDAKEGLSIEEFYTSVAGSKSSLFEGIPIDFTVRVKNTGSVHEQPAGQAIITDMFGNPVGAVNINLDTRNVLPGSIRKFEAPLDSAVIGNRILFGRYTANLTMTYGADKKTVTESLTFWVIPWKLILAVIIGIVGGFFLLRYALRRYNNYILSQARRRR